MFEISKEELENLRCQFGTSSWGGTRYSPMAFSEQGVAMLSSVLNSETAIEVNIQIIRIFNRFRETISVHQDIFLKLEKIENELTSNHKTNLKHDEEIQVIFSALKKLLNSPKKERESLGYKVK